MRIVNFLPMEDRVVADSCKPSLAHKACRLPAAAVWLLALLVTVAPVSPLMAQDPTPTPTPTASPSPEPTPTASPSPSPDPTPTPTPPPITTTTDYTNLGDGSMCSLGGNDSELTDGADLHYQAHLSAPELEGAFAMDVVFDQALADSVELNPVGPPDTYSLEFGFEPTGLELVLPSQPGSKEGSYVHSGYATDTATGDTAPFFVDNDPVPVAIVAVGIAACVCLIGMVSSWFQESCADKAIRACGGAGKVKKVEVRITAWSLLSGCRQSCSFECK